MTKEQFEELLGCPLEKVPMRTTATISAKCHGRKGTFRVLTVVVMEVQTDPYIQFASWDRSGQSHISHCLLKDYGLTWAASEKDWEFAKAYRERKNKEEGK